MESCTNNLKEIRKQHGISQDKLAESVDSCRNTISYIEKGMHEPSISLAYRIAAFFSLSVYDIFPPTAS